MTSVPFVQPQFNLKGFNCPNCSAFANFYWTQLCERGYQGNFESRPIHMATCSHCSQRTYWIEEEKIGRMLHPAVLSAPLPHEDLPEECVVEYLEARKVAGISPRSAAALLRLCLQRLCMHLGQSGKNINDDIASLVKVGLPVQIQQALDILRITGNNAVHPGEMSLDDNPEIVASLFDLINLVVDNRISQPKRVAALFSSLPGGALSAIAKRDAA